MVAEPLEPEPVIPRSADIDGVPMTVTMLHHAASGQGHHCTSWGAYGDRSLALGGSFSSIFSAGHSSWGTMYRYVSRTSKAMQRHAKPTIKAPRRENWSWQSRPFSPFTTGPASYFLPLSFHYVLQQRDVILYPHLEYISVSLLMPFGSLYVRNDAESL